MGSGKSLPLPLSFEGWVPVLLSLPVLLPFLRGFLFFNVEGVGPCWLLLAAPPSPVAARLRPSVCPGGRALASPVLGQWVLSAVLAEGRLADMPPCWIQEVGTGRRCVWPREGRKALTYYR